MAQGVLCVPNVLDACCFSPFLTLRAVKHPFAPSVHPILVVPITVSPLGKSFRFVVTNV